MWGLFLLRVCRWVCCGGSTLVFEFACATWAVKLFDTDEWKPTGQCQVSREWIWPHEKIPHSMSTTYCGMSLVLSPPTLQSDLCACVLLKLLLSWLCSKERTIDCLSKIAQGKYTAAVISIFQCRLSNMVQKLEDPLAFLRTVLDLTVSHVDMFDLGSFGLSQVKNDSVWLLQFVNPRYVHYSKVFWLAALPSVWIEETWPSNPGQSQYCEFFSSDSKKMSSKKDEFYAAPLDPGPVQFQVNFRKEGQQFIGKSMKFQSLKLSFYTNSIPCKGVWNALPRTSKMAWFWGGACKFDPASTGRLCSSLVIPLLLREPRKQFLKKHKVCFQRPSLKVLKSAQKCPKEQELKKEALRSLAPTSNHRPTSPQAVALWHDQGHIDGVHRWLGQSPNGFGHIWTWCSKFCSWRSCCPSHLPGSKNDGGWHAMQSPPSGIPLFTVLSFVGNVAL